MRNVDDASAVEVARIDAAALHVGLVRALADACRTGIPVVRLSQHRSLTVGSAHIVTNAREATLNELSMQIAASAVREARARSAYLEDQGSDLGEDLKDAWKSEMRVRKGFEAQRAELLDAPLLEVAPARFTTETDVLTRVMKRLVHGPLSFTQDEIAAFSVLVPQVGVYPKPNGLWVGRATLRLPVDGGVVEVGPVEWPVQPRGNGGTRVAAYIPQDGPAPLSKSKAHIVHLLRAAGFSAAAASAVLGSPFTQLAHVLVVQDPDRLRETVGEQWANPAFVEHVRNAYRQVEDQRPYTWVSHARQAVVDIVADHGGAATLAQIQEVVPWFERPYLLSLAKLRGNPTPWYPSFDVGRGEGRSTLVHNIVCACGRLATVVARVAEVPGDLLCPCGRAPRAAELGAPDVVFPAEYQRLAVPREQWMEHLQTPDADAGRVAKLAGKNDRARAKHQAPGSRADAVVRALSGTDGRTVQELAQLLGFPRQAVGQVVDGLRERGEIEPDGGWPRRWRLVEGSPRA